MTCPSPAEINKALGCVSLEQLGKSCTLEELMEKCIRSFDVDGKLWRNEETIHMILVMHSWVVPSVEFARKLLQLYREATQNQRRMQICHVLRFWVNQYPEVFRLDNELEELMGDFWEVVKDKRRLSVHRNSIDSSCFSDQEMTKPFPESPSFNKKRKVSLLLDHLEPSELADHLSYMEFKCVCRITLLDYQNYILQSSLREIPRLERSVNLCNSISQWVQLMILKRPTPQQRAEVFTKFIQVTQKLRKLQNFNTLMAVIGGLCHSAISRLKETHSYLSHDVLKTLSGMTELLSSSSNYSTYRRVYNECGGFKIPILGVQLKDLVSLNEALPDYLDNGKINVSKLQSLYQHILELHQLQKASPPFKANKDVIMLLTTSLDTFYTEDEIYSLSYTREPRSPKLMPITPTKPPEEIVDWTPVESLQLDPESLSHSVDQMVKAVFQSYDPDQRGFISREDFEKVVSSLPFSCHILEKDREGAVDHHEITSYFMKASQVCSRLGLPFLQSLVEIRLKETPLCTNCIWSVGKQGYVSAGLDKDGIENWPTSQKSAERKGSEREKTYQAEGLQRPGRPIALDSCHTKCQYGDSCKTSETLLKKLKDTEEERSRLLMENARLHSTNSQLAADNANLHSQLSVLQDKVQALSKDSKMKPALTQILETLKALRIQSDTNH
ncbi:RAS guanyl-releasing protein 4 isoform X2 [Hyla sarda]|nr:RAS guanyl-releasing protein 4 isoform X2 [Hyla sarda]XP_056396088.1 RAS guanyl-releasing protein 4 isoform X2 [Hyla sarda]XP_056396089.1 RAS guanyl-releasing protein 4 isoform X2 [Hyla sarda]XP_056396090.1 RAS guanyl-releasing protein 4 isoform X2 [Hyla sarda]